jgi:preprotein translocase subunit SecA
MIASDFPEAEATQMEAFLGHYLVNEVYRRLLLRVISDEWVEYLTKMEALRVSVAMESYAQRNPLVVYKSEASDNYRILLSDIRMRVISGMFTVRPNRETAATVARPAAAPSTMVTPANEVKKSGGKRKRKRH